MNFSQKLARSVNFKFSTPINVMFKIAFYLALLLKVNGDLCFQYNFFPFKCYVTTIIHIWLD